MFKRLKFFVAFPLVAMSVCGSVYGGNSEPTPPPAPACSDIITACCSGLASTPTFTPTPSKITIEPVESYNTIKTQHTFIVTVTDDVGRALADEPVEWMLNRFPGAVGDIVAVAPAKEGAKVDNAYAVTRTGKDGKASLTITSARPGDTEVTAYCPNISDSTQHKVFAVKHWLDLMVYWPSDAVNVAGTTHTLTTRLIKSTTGEPVSNYAVRWTITGDRPDAAFTETGTNEAITQTDANGKASVTIKQVGVARGENIVKVEIFAPNGVSICQKEVSKKWTFPGIKISKEGPASAGIAKELSYSITVANTGDADATGVVVTDVLPEGMSYVSSKPEGTVKGNKVTWNLGTMAARASGTLTLTVRAERIGEWTDTAVVTCAEGLTAQDSATTTVEQAVIEIEKKGPPEVGLAKDVGYIIVVRNPGKYQLTGVVVTDALPKGMGYVGSKPEGTLKGNKVTWNLGTMAAGAESKILLTLHTQNVGDLVNIASVITEQGATATTQTTTSVVPQPAMAITIADTVDPVAVGETTVYTVTVRNQGQKPTTNVQVVFVVPEEMTFVEASGPAAYAVEKGVVTFDPVAGVDVKSTLTYNITVRAKSTGSAVAKATLRYGEFSRPVITEEGTTIY